MKWIVRVGRREEVFEEGFLAAHKWLLDELWWLAEDYQSEKTFDAWAEVVSWEQRFRNADYGPFSVRAGEPPEEYRLFRRGMENYNARP